MPERDKIKRIVSQQISDIASKSGGCYILMPPADSKLWRPGYHLLAKNRALALADARQNLFEHNKSINQRVQKQAPVPNPRNYSDKSFRGVAREWFENNTTRWVPSYAVRLKNRLEEDLIAPLETRDVSNISALELLSLIRQIENAVPWRPPNACCTWLEPSFDMVLRQADASVIPPSI